MASWSTSAQGLKQGVGEENVFMQPSGGGPDHKAFWVKKQLPKKCGATEMPRCPEICSLLSMPSSLWVFRVQFPVMWIYIRLVAIYQTALGIQGVKSNHGTSPFVHISINQFTTFQYVVLYSLFNNWVHTVCARCRLHTHLFSTKTLLIPGQLRWTRATWQKS